MFVLAKFDTPVSQLDWFMLLQSVGIIASLLFSAWTLKRASNDSKLANFLRIVENHRSLWVISFDNNDIQNIFSDKSRIGTSHLSMKQRQFITFMFLHLSSVFELNKKSAIIPIEGLKDDLIDLFTNSTIKAFWEENKKFYNQDFSVFVDKIFK